MNRENTSRRLWSRQCRRSIFLGYCTPRRRLPARAPTTVLSSDTRARGRPRAVGALLTGGLLHGKPRNTLRACVPACVVGGGAGGERGGRSPASMSSAAVVMSSHVGRLPRIARKNVTPTPPQNASRAIDASTHGIIFALRGREKNALRASYAQFAENPAPKMHHRHPRPKPPAAPRDAADDSWFWVLLAAGGAFLFVVFLIVVGFWLTLWWANSTHTHLRRIAFDESLVDSPCATCSGNCVVAGDCPSIHVVNSAGLTIECKYSTCVYVIDPAFTAVPMGPLANHWCIGAVDATDALCMIIYATPNGDYAGGCEAYYPCATVADDAFVTRVFESEKKAQALFAAA